jgi:hypothetical protein
MLTYRISDKEEAVLCTVRHVERWWPVGYTARSYISYSDGTTAVEYFLHSICVPGDGAAQSISKGCTC